jgi:hypothetical protein
MLFTGVALVSALLGYVVSGAASPTAGAAVTAVFALVAAVFGLRGTGQAIEALARMKELGIELPDDLVGWLRTEAEATRRRAGALLCVFVLAFVPGSYLGARMRIDGWFAPPAPEVRLPWKGAEPPADPGAALSWILMGDGLRALGFSEEEVRAVYTRSLEAPRGPSRPPTVQELELLLRASGRLDGGSTLAGGASITRFP